jgi:hypothetical protein
MHGIGLNDPLQKWFEFKVPKTKVAPDFIQKVLEQDIYTADKPTTKIVYLGKPPIVEHLTKSKKGNSWEITTLTFQDKRAKYSISVDREQGNWLVDMLQTLSINNPKMCTLQDVMDSYKAAGLEDFELFWDNKPVNTLYKVGLLKL